MYVWQQEYRLNEQIVLTLLYRLALKGILLQLMYPCQIVIHELYDFSEWPLSIFHVLLHSLEICGDRF